jgi:hypothetical protein
LPGFSLEWFSEKGNALLFSTDSEALVVSFNLSIVTSRTLIIYFG